MNIFADKKISDDLVYAIATIAIVGLFVVANYFFGFNLYLYMITLAIGAVISFAKPRAGLFAIIFLTFLFERFFTLAPIVMGRSEYKLYPIDVLLGALLVGILFQLVGKTLETKFRKIDLLVLAFSMLAALYFFVSAFLLKGETSLAFSSAKNYAFYSLLYFATFILIDNKERFKDLAKVIFAGAVGILWFVFYGMAVRRGLWSDFTPLSTEGIRTLAFTHAFYLSMTFIGALVYMAYRSDKISKWLLLLAPIWALGILGSMMRHLWISLFAAVVFLIVMLTRTERLRLKKYALKYAVICLGVSVFAIYGAIMFPRSLMYEKLADATSMVSHRVTSIADTGGDESIVWRSAVWKQAIKQYENSPITGIGFGKKISVEIGKYKDFVEVRNIHNSFLVLLVQMGIVGLGLVAALVAALGWKVLRTRFNDDFMQAAAYITLGILVLQVVAFMFQPYLEANLLGIFFWINLGILRRLNEAKKD